MITNLVASIAVSLVTNVTEQITGYEHYEPAPCPEGRIGCLVFHQRGVNPTHKTITTNVIEITTITFDWLGTNQTVKVESLISAKSGFWSRAWTSSPFPPPVDSEWHYSVPLTNIWIGPNGIIQFPKIQ